MIWISGMLILAIIVWVLYWDQNKGITNILEDNTARVLFAISIILSGLQIFDLVNIESSGSNLQNTTVLAATTKYLGMSALEATLGILGTLMFLKLLQIKAPRKAPAESKPFFKDSKNITQEEKEAIKQWEKNTQAASARYNRDLLAYAKVFIINFIAASACLFVSWASTFIMISARITNIMIGDTQEYVSMLVNTSDIPIFGSFIKGDNTFVNLQGRDITGVFMIVMNQGANICVAIWTVYKNSITSYLKELGK